MTNYLILAWLAAAVVVAVLYPVTVAAVDGVTRARQAKAAAENEGEGSVNLNGASPTHRQAD